MTDAYEQSMGPLARLRHRISAILAERGLALLEMSVAPGTTADGPHELHILAMLADAVPREQKPHDDGFDEVLRQARDADLERQTQEAIEQLRQELRDDGGFL